MVVAGAGSLLSSLGYPIDGTAKAIDALIVSGVNASQRRRARSSRRERLAVYGHFQHAVLEFLINQQLLRSTIPSFKGGLWSMPVHFRRLREMDHVMKQLVTATADLRLVGNPDPCERGEALLPHSGRLAGVQAPMKATDVQDCRNEMQANS